MELIRPAAFVQLFGYVAVALTLCSVAYRFLPRYRGVVLTVALLLMARIVLLENPFAWRAYNNWLSASDLGFRQKDVVQHRWMSFRRPPEEVRYLGLGTSQAGAIFQLYVRYDDSFVVFSLAGMSMLDFLLYREQILSYRPHAVLIYVSEFDIGRERSLATLSMAPSQGTFLAEISKYVDFSDSADRDAFAALIAGEFFPEYKYGFVFKGLKNKYFGRTRALDLLDETAVSDDVNLKMHLASLATLGEAPVEENVQILSDFIDFCLARGVGVVLVEGEYNPLAYDDDNKRLHALVHERLNALADDHEGVQFLPRGSVMSLGVEDFRDGYHVKPEVGLQFSRRLMEVLNSDPPDNPVSAL